MVLSVNNLSIAFGGLKAVDDLSFQIDDNQIYGLIGPNGAGKSTVFNCITQFYKANTGTVTYYNNVTGKEYNLMRMKAHQIIGVGIVRTFQNVEVIGELRVIDNIMLGAHCRFKANAAANAFCMPWALKEEKAFRAMAFEIMEHLGIAHLAYQYAAAQPYGVLKKIELGRTLMSDPRLVLLDEPAAGLNDTETEEMAKTIREIRDTRNCSVLLVEHDMRLVMGVCDRICVINFGKRIAEGTPVEVQRNKDVQEAYLGKEE